MAVDPIGELFKKHPPPWIMARRYVRDANGEVIFLGIQKKALVALVNSHETASIIAMRAENERLRRIDELYGDADVHPS